MQVKKRLPVGRVAAILLAGVLGLTAGCGCGPKPVVPAETVKPHAAAGLKVWYGDENLTEAFSPRARAWAFRNGASVTAAATPAEADVLLVPAYRLGTFDPPAGLRPVPAAIVGEGSNFQWGGLLAVYQSRLAHWGGERYAVPLTGEGYVLLYRADVLDDPDFAAAFVQNHARPPLPVRTWTDLADLGRFATGRTGKPALPPLPADPHAAVATFGHIAACYDRPPLTGGPKADGGDAYFRGLSFFTDVDALRNGPADRWEVRVDKPAFGEAFRWFESTAKLRPAEPGDPTAAVLSGSAVAAVVPLGELNRLPRDPKTGMIDGKKFGVGAVPGSDGYFDDDGKRQKTTGANRIPYHPGGGLVGVVRQSAPNPDAAWALLGELGGPIGSTATLDTPAVGGGPLRTEQAGDSPRQWQQYGFDKERTADLARAVREYVAPNTLNPAVGLRTPDVDAVHALLAKALTQVAGGGVTADAGQAQAVKGWKELDAKTPREKRATDRKRAAGLD
jgi:ABC-type glycerol-3-phosphate transport system substrate-binding protein